MADEIKAPALLHIQGANLPTDFLTTDHITECVNSALRQYSSDRPRYLFGIIAGDGSSIYDISDASITGWVEQGSEVLRVDAPWSLADPNEIENDKWTIEEDPTTGLNLVLVDASPAVGESIRIQFTGEWDEGSVPSSDLSNVAKLAASSMCRMLASRYSQAGDSTISADVFNSSSQVEQLRSLARDFESQYKKGIGSQDGDTVTASSIEFSLDPGSNHGYGKLNDY